jgi:hypothetical protein
MEIGPAVDFPNESGSGPSPADGAASPPGNVISKQFLWIGAALAAVTVAVYAPVRHFGFLGFDDLEYVTDNARGHASAHYNMGNAKN